MGGWGYLLDEMGIYAYFSLFFFTGSVSWGCELMDGYHDTFFLPLGWAGLGRKEKGEEEQWLLLRCG